ncbi:MAG TPA: hypothetical protein VHR97_01715 [Candidatus Baltobacteraceae bacterium]|jgi:hypothetical protein|nr:hypothetical protein [Candidatus Baltobacteraceae bacterium]
MIDESKRSEIDVIAHQGNVVLRDWVDDCVAASHTMTPLKAKELAEQLLGAADRAEKAMPKL